VSELTKLLPVVVKCSFIHRKLEWVISDVELCQQSRDYLLGHGRALDTSRHSRHNQTVLRPNYVYLGLLMCIWPTYVKCSLLCQ